MTLTDLLSALVAINSINPALVAGAPGERAITDFISHWLGGHGVEVMEVPAIAADRDCPSLLCRVPGKGTGRGLVLYAHTDTVGVDGMTDPFTAVIRDGALHGRGAWDMKGSLAVIMRVAAQIAAAPCAGDVWLMLVADEENASAGAEAVLAECARRRLDLHGCIVAEPSDLRVMIGHRGFATGTIVTRGRAAHTARRDEGIDAIAMMARVIVGLEDLDARMNADAGHPVLGHSAVVTSLVRGGSELYTYPSRCEAQFVWRTLPADTQPDATAAVERIFAENRSRTPHFAASLEWSLWRAPMLIDPDAPLARIVARAAQDAIGSAPDVCAAPWWTDAALIQAAGIPTVIFGPPGGGIHSADEWVNVAGLERFEHILLNITRSFCG